MPLKEIYSFITNRYPFYSEKNKKWMNTIRSTLSNKNYFLKVPRAEGGNFWRMKPDRPRKNWCFSRRHTSQKNTYFSVENMSSSFTGHINDKGDKNNSSKIHDKQLLSRRDQSDEDKPPFSSEDLIVEAISSVEEDRIDLNCILSYTSKHHSYYSLSQKGWQNY